MAATSAADAVLVHMGWYGYGYFGLHSTQGIHDDDFHKSVCRGPYGFSRFCAPVYAHFPSAADEDEAICELALTTGSVP